VAPWITGIAAVLTAIAGVVWLIYEFRRRDHRELTKEIHTLTRELHDSREQEIQWRDYAHGLREQLADLGVDTDPP
jgi:hypothetical protein